MGFMVYRCTSSPNSTNQNEISSASKPFPGDVRNGKEKLTCKKFTYDAKVLFEGIQLFPEHLAAAWRY